MTNPHSSFVFNAALHLNDLKSGLIVGGPCATVDFYFHTQQLTSKSSSNRYKLIFAQLLALCSRLWDQIRQPSRLRMVSRSYLKHCIPTMRSRSVVVITLGLHPRGPQFEPGRDHNFGFYLMLKLKHDFLYHMYQCITIPRFSVLYTLVVYVAQ